MGLLVLLLTTSCSNNKKRTSSENKKIVEHVSNVTGNLNLEVDDILLPFAQEIAKDFRGLYPKIEINIAATNSAVALQGIEDGSNDIALVSTPATDLRNNTNLNVQTLFSDFLVLIVNFNNPYLQTLVMEGISQKNIADLLTYKKTQWKQLNNQFEGNEPLKMYIPPRHSGTIQYIASFAGVKKELIKADDVIFEKEIPVNVANQTIALGFCSHTLAYDPLTQIRRSGIYIVGLDVDNSEFLENNELVFDDLQMLTTAFQNNKLPATLKRTFSAVNKKDNPNAEIVELFLNHLQSYGPEIAKKYNFFLETKKIKQ